MPALIVNKQYEDPIPPTVSQLDAAYESIELFFNVIGIGADNIQDGSLDGTKLANSSVTETKLSANVIATGNITNASVTVAKLAQELQNVLFPTGSIMAGAMDVAPTGWLLCDGTPQGRTQYQNLYNLVGTRFGGGNGVDTFNIPDLRGRFLRGIDAGSNRDPDSALRTEMNSGGATGGFNGSVQADDWQWDAVNDILQTPYLFPPPPGNAGFTVVDAAAFGLGGGPSSEIVYQNVDGTSAGLDTHPKNAYVNFFIKV